MIAWPTVVVVLVNADPPVHVLVSVRDLFVILETMYANAQRHLPLAQDNKQGNIVMHRQTVAVEFASVRHLLMLVQHHRLINVSVGHVIVEIREAPAVAVRQSVSMELVLVSVKTISRSL